MGLIACEIVGAFYLCVLSTVVIFSLYSPFSVPFQVDTVPSCSHHYWPGIQENPTVWCLAPCKICPRLSVCIAACVEQ